jgi:tetratricopeptide (TPR) repeat protein
MARRAAEKALSLNPNLAEAYDNVGWIYMYYDLDLAKANIAFQRALTLDPSNVSALNNAAAMQSCLGKIEEAITLYNKAILADPLYPASYNGLSLEYFYKGEWKESEAAIHKALEITPDYGSGYYQLARVQLGKGDNDAALKSINQEKDELWRLSGLALVYFKMNRKDEANASLQKLIDGYAEGAAYQIAGAYAYRGEPDSAFEWLERAFQQRPSATSRRCGAASDPSAASSTSGNPDTSG